MQTRGVEPADVDTAEGPLSPASLAAGIASALLEAGAAAVGVCGVEELGRAREVLEARHAAGLHGGMQFTFRNPARSTDARRALPSAASAVVVALPYDTDRGPQPSGLVAEVARYAAVDTYAELRRVLRVGAELLGNAGHRAVPVLDDNALVDRAMAMRAGIGWLGKNSNILVPGAGSWVVLGSILTDAALPGSRGFGAGATQPAADLEAGCGTCSRCIRECPTGAILVPGVVDPGRCLSWLLQRRGDFPRSHRVALGARIYGCDDCQLACPPSTRAVGAVSTEVPGGQLVASRGPGSSGWVSVQELLELDDQSLLERFGTWYIADRDPRYLRRNALVVLGNLMAGRSGAREWASTGAAHARARALLRRYLRDEDPMLVAHAAWAARRAGEGDLLTESGCAGHPEVLAELARPAPHRDNGADGSA